MKMSSSRKDTFVLEMRKRERETRRGKESSHSAHVKWFPLFIRA